MQSNSNTSTLQEDARANQTYVNTNRRSNQGLSHMRTSENTQNIHTDEADAATNQSGQKAELETTTLQDTFSSGSIADEYISLVTAAQAYVHDHRERVVGKSYIDDIINKGQCTGTQR